MAAAPTPERFEHTRLRSVLIEDELKTAFLDYAMSVVVSRALPDVRDGLKPVHRRILYAMYLHGFFHNRPYHKSVRVVGDVLGKYHPHGDQAVYNTMVGMVQDFSKRYPLLDGQGNWGSVDGDNAAAMRYTEVRMQKIALELLADLDKETVSFVPNFDESTVEPVVLPSKLPHLLINGATGIAVGMATAIPPHNLTEVVTACRAFLANEDISDEELFALIPAPDFPTGGIICGRAGIVKAYTTGRGSLVLRGVATIEETKNGSAIIITELPYQVVKAELIIRVADLVKNKIIEGITNIRDESDRSGMRVVIEVRRGEMPTVILNQLYKHTQLETSVTLLMLALIENRPIVFTLREMIREFIAHREEVIRRRTQFDLSKARAREHILAGLIIALHNVDAVIALIKTSHTPEEAIHSLGGQFGLSPEQSKAILEMRLQRLTGLEQEKIAEEIAEIRLSIADLETILGDRARLRSEIDRELAASIAEYGDARRSQIEGPIDILSEADLIPDEDMVVTLTGKGYIKRVGLDVYGVQHRGGRGKLGVAALDESDDYIEDLFAARNHDELLFFTNTGRIYSLTVFQIPEASRTAKGRAIVNMLPLQQGERIVKLLCVRDFAGKYLVMLTKDGTIKRTHAEEFSKIRSTGIRAITLDEGNELVSCALSSGSDSVVIATAHGFGIRFDEHEVRAMGRQAAGVRGIKLRKGDTVIGMQVISGEKDLLFATASGFGKRVAAADFRVAHRGGLGVRTIPTEGRNGEVIGLVVVEEGATILLIDEKGTIIRLSPNEVRTMGRQAQGVRLIRLDDEQRLAAVVASREQSEVV
jgi:DNA gyrase subunit A